jgi:hypothetical protein
VLLVTLENGEWTYVSVLLLTYVFRMTHLRIECLSLGSFYDTSENVGINMMEDTFSSND